MTEGEKQPSDKLTVSASAPSLSTLSWHVAMFCTHPLLIFSRRNQISSVSIMQTSQGNKRHSQPNQTKWRWVWLRITWWVKCHTSFFWCYFVNHSRFCYVLIYLWSRGVYLAIVVVVGVVSQDFNNQDHEWLCCSKNKLVWRADTQARGPRSHLHKHGTESETKGCTWTTRGTMRSFSDHKRKIEIMTTSWRPNSTTVDPTHKLWPLVIGKKESASDPTRRESNIVCYVQTRPQNTENTSKHFLFTSS